MRAAQRDEQHARVVVADAVALLQRALHHIERRAAVFTLRDHEPGNVAAALALDTSHSSLPLFRARGPLTVREGDAPSGIVRGPRVGIGYATPEHQAAPWRLAIADNLWVSARRDLR